MFNDPVMKGRNDLDEEEVKALLYSQEAASFDCRWHVAKLPAGVPRLVSCNRNLKVHTKEMVWSGFFRNLPQVSLWDAIASFVDNMAANKTAGVAMPWAAAGFNDAQLAILRRCSFLLVEQPLFTAEDRDIRMGAMRADFQHQVEEHRNRFPHMF